MKKKMILILLLSLLFHLPLFSHRQAYNFFWNHSPKSFGITWNNFCEDGFSFVKNPINRTLLILDTLLFYGGDTIPIRVELRPFDLQFSTISDEYGNFLFFTDGVRIYNKEFQIMENGDSLCFLPLKPYVSVFSPSYMPGVLHTKPTIIPFPNNPNKFYLFVRVCVTKYPSPIPFTLPFFVTYSIVDLSYNNGLGKVIEKKKFLYDDIFFYVDYIPILHKNNEDIWLLAIDTNGYVHNFLITKDGIKGGEIKYDNFRFPKYNSLLKIINSNVDIYFLNNYTFYFPIVSPNGNLIAYIGEFSSKIDIKKLLWKFASFNRETGEINDILSIEKMPSHPIFSPNSKKVYFRVRNFIYDSTGTGGFKISIDSSLLLGQYDFSLLDSINIINSFKSKLINNFFQDNSGYRAGFLPPIDGKFYFYTTLDDTSHPAWRLIIIENPNESVDSPLFTVTKIDSFPVPYIYYSFVHWVEPMFFHSYLYRLIDYRKPACEGGELRFFFTPFFPQEILNQSGVEFEWSGPAGFYSKDTLPYIPNLGKENFGWYRVKIKTPTEEFTDSVYVFREAGLKIKIDKSDDLVEGDSVRLYLDKRYSEIEWFDGTSDTSVVVRRTGKYWVCVVDTFCCRSCDTIYVKFLKPEEVTTVSLPDTSGVVGDANFCIPLSARKTIGRKLEGIKYKGEIRFDARAFAPKANYNSRIENGECVVDVEGEIADWESERKELERICGTILLSDKKKVPLKISRFEMEMNDTLFEPVKEDGSLQITGVCEPELSQIEYAPTVELREIHRTSRGRYEILLNATAEVEIRARVYNLLGEEIISESGIQLERGINAIELPIKLRSGVYLLVIESNLGSRKPYKFVVTE
jgi:hypothetical protein